MTVLRWAEADRERLRAVLPDALVVLPIGAIEQHGPHLATGTDALLAGAVVRRAAELADTDRPLVLAPTVCFGSSDHHFPFGGTLSLTASTLLAVLDDLSRSIAASGGRRMVMVNGHGGNRGVCHAAAATASSRQGLSVGYVDYWTLAPDVGDTPVPGHAGEFETALVLALRPELAHDRAPRTTVPRTPHVSDIDIHSAADWRIIDGYTDDPAQADAERGRDWWEHIAAELANRFAELARKL